MEHHHNQQNNTWNMGGFCWLWDVMGIFHDFPFISDWWFGTCFFIFSHMLGMSSSQLTNSYFSEG
jgi:hypothetical protein